MFKRQSSLIKEIIMQNLRQQGLETPLLQKRLVDSWPSVAGQMAARYTTNVYIYNQVLYVRLSSPALRSELSMQRNLLVKQLNEVAGAQIITDIRFC